MRALIFDSEYDIYKGVVAYVRVVDGQIKKDGKTATIQGISVFAEGHLYTFVALSDSGYSADLERLLNSIAFKF